MSGLLDFFMGKEREQTYVVEEEDFNRVQHDKESMTLAVTELSNQGKMFEAQYGPISEYEYQEAINSRTPQEIAWEQKASNAFWPKVGFGALVGGALGVSFARGQASILIRSRKQIMDQHGKKALKDPVVQTASWAEDTKKVNRWSLAMFGLGAFVGGNVSFSKYYPVYLEEVASLPNSQMALALKRMHRQYEISQAATLKPVQMNKVASAQTELDSKKSYEEARVPTELAAGQAMAAGLSGGGYKAGGS
eukprot:TRINITY_DN5407_c0_g1_i1.p3 TRINITY_DN5407_c0_g1~~TRINITY_DN5407_c0_g1_i1.p3  ORF type:complete len:261 (+),score=46.76 TRINITY_DN5407_c0_g1_i1:36-785(+)